MSRRLRSTGFPPGSLVCLAAAAALLFCAQVRGADPPAPPAGATADGLRLVDALRRALEGNAEVQVSRQQVVGSAGQHLAAQGSFDTVLSANGGHTRSLRPLRQDERDLLALAGVAESQQSVSTTAYGVAANRTLLNGVSAEAGVSVNDSDDNLLGLRGVPNQNSGTLSFSLRVPFLKNAGREVVGSEIDATAAELQASYFELAQSSADTVLAATLAYWDYLAKERRLAIAVAAEKRIDDLVSEMRRLIAADKLPRSEIELVLASRAERRTQRAAAEQALEESRRVLARVLGLSLAEMRALKLPADEFPAYEQGGLTGLEDWAGLAEFAVRNRADVAALRLREEAARYRVNAARHNLKPQVDLNLNFSYTGLAEGASSYRIGRALGDNQVGPAVSAIVGVELPLQNSAAKGSFQAQSAVYDTALIRLRDQEAFVATSVPVAIDALRRAAEQLQEGVEAVRRYSITLQNEQTKRRLGKATVIDVINIEDRLNNALGNEVNLRQFYAGAIARLRFELGTLVQRQGENYDVRVQDLLTARFGAEK